MGLERTSDNFDINAILSAVNGANGNAQPQGSYSALLDDMDSVEAERLGLDDPVQVAIIREINSLVSEFAANRSSGSGNELEAMLVTNIAAKLPAGMRAEVASAIILEAERRDNMSDNPFGFQQWERLKEDVKREREAKANAEKIAEDVQDIQQQQEQQRQARAEAWRNEEHDYAGQRMTGAQWMQMIQWFRTPENRTAWEDAMMAETGQSREQVRATGTRMDRYFDLMEKQANGETLTSDEQVEFNTLDQDPDIRRGVTTMQSLQANRPGMSASADTPVSANIEGDLRNGVSATAANSRSDVYGDVAATAATRTTSVAAGLDGGTTTASASALSANFNIQATGAPMPPPPPVSVQPAPQLTAASVQVDAGNMFG